MHLFWAFCSEIVWTGQHWQNPSATPCSSTSAAYSGNQVRIQSYQHPCVCPCTQSASYLQDGPDWQQACSVSCSSSSDHNSGHQVCSQVCDTRNVHQNSSSLICQKWPSTCATSCSSSSQHCSKWEISISTPTHNCVTQVTTCPRPAGQNRSGLSQVCCSSSNQSLQAESDWPKACPQTCVTSCPSFIQAGQNRPGTCETSCSSRIEVTPGVQVRPTICPQDRDTSCTFCAEFSYAGHHWHSYSATCCSSRCESHCRS